MKVLIITNTIPYPTTSGGALRNYNLIKRIADQNQVWLATSLESEQELNGVPHLKGFCEEVITSQIKRKRKINHIPGLVRYAIKGWPFELKFRECLEFGLKIQQISQRIPFDIIQIEESRMALYLEYLPKTHLSKRILTFYDIAFAQARRFTSLEKDPWMKLRSQIYSHQMRGWEPHYARRFDRAIAVSQADKDILIHANPELSIEVISNGVDTRSYQPLPVNQSRPVLLFIGNMSYLPCVDGALYLVKEILPYLGKKLNGLETWLVGADPAPEILQLADQDIHVTGRVTDIRSYYEKCTISVVPIRAGGGTRLKILEAMAFGRPVVSTSIGCEGLDVIDGEHLLIANRPEEFVRQITRLSEDSDLYQRITSSARTLVTEKYDWDGISRKLMDLYEELVSEITRR